jgi:formate dehydrogenase major subunit
MTNGWIDIKNTDMMLIMGGNPAENHPCGFKWAMEAKRNRNAKLISVDPRFTRTSATADLFLPNSRRHRHRIPRRADPLRHREQSHRQGISRQLHERRVHRQGGFQTSGGWFVFGFDAAAGAYDKSTWNYEGGRRAAAGGRARIPVTRPNPCRASRRASAASGSAPKRGLRPDAAASALRLPTAEAAVFALHARTRRADHGHPEGPISEGRRLFTSVRKDGDMKKVATIIYAVGWTQHTFGTQIIRTAAMIQLLLGNVGRAGGGVNALRGHSNIQGATDMAGLYDSLPGYLKAPVPADTDLAAFLKRTTPTASKPSPWDSMNYYSNTPKFMVSLLKALYGDAATKENGFAFDYLPKSRPGLFVDPHLGRHVQRQRSRA